MLKTKFDVPELTVAADSAESIISRNAAFLIALFEVTDIIGGKILAVDAVVAEVPVVIDVAATEDKAVAAVAGANRLKNREGILPPPGPLLS